MSYTVKQCEDALKVLDLINAKKRQGTSVVSESECIKAVRQDWPEVRGILFNCSLIMRVDSFNYAIADSYVRERSEGDIANMLSNARRDARETRINKIVSYVALFISLGSLIMSIVAFCKGQ